MREVRKMRVEAQQPSGRMESTVAVVRRFHEATNARDIDAMMALMTDDCVFETTSPPDGERFEGTDEVRGAFLNFLESSTEPRFEIEEMVICEDRATVQWLYRWTNADGSDGHVRGVDVMRVRDGKVAESLA